MWIDFWELAGGRRQPNAMIATNRVYGLATGGSAALQVVSSMIHLGWGRSAEQSVSVLYPEVGRHVGQAPPFLSSDSSPAPAGVNVPLSGRRNV